MTLENQETINSTDLKEKTRSKRKSKNKKRKISLSFMTLILLVLVIQLSYSALFNISKIVIYTGKKAQARELKEQAEAKNRQLKNEIENFNSMNRVESIARNNLKMAGENEVLVIINTPKEEEKPKTKTQEFIEYFEKNIARKFVKGENNSDFILPEPE